MSNLYHFDDVLKTNLDKPTFIKAGIVEPLFLKNVVSDTGKNGSNFIAFYFEDEHGNKMSHTEFEPSSLIPINEMDIKQREEFLGKVENQKERIKQIIKAYLPNEKFNYKPDSFKEYAEIIVRILKGKCEDVPVRAKIVYNDKGFTTLPKYSKYKFIEPTSISKESSRISPLSIDVFTRPEKPAPNVHSKDNILEVEFEKNEVKQTELIENTEDKKEDLPF